MRKQLLAPLAVLLFLPMGARAAGSGKAFNPDIGVNFLGLAQNGTAYSKERTAKLRNGLQLQEAEFQFSSDVDPYFRANALFAVAQEDGKSSFGIDPEEVFLESISLPYVTVKAGKFKAAMGRHNQLHTHAFPFVSAPLIHQRLLGDEGLNDSGVSVAGLIPLPWFSEATLQALSLANDKSFNSRNSDDLGYLARLRNLWDLSDSATVELGLSGMRGDNQFGRVTTLVGSDLTLKWRPSEGGRYRAVVWSTEYLQAHVRGRTADRTVADPSVSGAVVTVTEPTDTQGGLATWLQFQFAERWWIQGRYEYVGLPQSRPLNAASKESALLGFFPSEFSGLRLQFDWTQDSARPQRDRAIALQYNVSLGAHPAHAY